MANLVKSYWSEDDAMDEMVTKILFVVGAIIIVMAIVWLVYNQISKKADAATEEINNGSNPGSGHEFDGNPFGN